VQEFTYPSEPGAIEAKFHMSEVLGVPINGVQKFKEHVGRRGGARAGGVAAGRPEVPA
jgi:hypothetical protein